MESEQEQEDFDGLGEITSGRLATDISWDDSLTADIMTDDGQEARLQVMKG
jgi:hypothetical protein